MTFEIDFLQSFMDQTDGGLFVEPFAGFASVSLAHRLGGAVPNPGSRMGAKRRYAPEILSLLGVLPEHQFEYVWGEVDPGCALYLSILAGGKLGEVATLLASWNNSFRAAPKEFWEAQVDRVPTTETEAVALWVFMNANAYNSALAAKSGWRAGGCWLWARKTTGLLRYPPNYLSQKLERLAPWDRPTQVLPSAEKVVQFVETHAASHGVAYLDPPYENTRDYNNPCPRALVIEYAQRLHQCGLRVGISEHCAIPSLVNQGWQAHRLATPEQHRSRNYSTSKEEWLTTSPV